MMAKTISNLPLVVPIVWDQASKGLAQPMGESIGLAVLQTITTSDLQALDNP